MFLKASIENVTAEFEVSAGCGFFTAYGSLPSPHIIPHLTSHHKDLSILMILEH
jgi:hypothetical protein